ncbi:hypothetical protein D3C75_624160 [compost metagenome]
MDAALGHVNTVEQHVTITGRGIAADQHRFFPLVDVGQDCRVLAGHPGRRGPQVRGQFKAEVGLLVILAGGDLLARSGQLASLRVLEQQRHADHVLRFDVVAVLRVGRDHAHQFFGGGGHHVDLDAVLHQFVVQLLLAREDFRRVDVELLDHIAFVIGGRHRFAGRHHLVDVALELLERKAGEHLGDPWIANHVVEFTEAVVVAEQAFLVVGGVLERHQFQGGIELVAGDQALVLHERQQRLFEVIAVTGVVHVEHRVVTFVGVGRDHRVQCLGLVGWPVFQIRCENLAGKAQAKCCSQ